MGNAMQIRYRNGAVENVDCLGEALTILGDSVQVEGVWKEFPYGDGIIRCKLVWNSEEEAENDDDGERAVAEIVEWME